MLRALFIVVAAAHFLGSVMGAVTAEATCLSSFSWASNSLHQSPCLVASYLLSPCTDGAHDVPALPEGDHYLGPDTLAASTPCQCSTVTYSLLSACGLCQNRTAESWSAYSFQCSHVDVGSYPNIIPLGTAVPGWAYLSIAADSFDVATAQQSANTSIESVGPQPPSTTASSTVSTRIQTSTSSVAHQSLTKTAISSTASPSSSSVSPSPAASDNTLSQPDSHTNAIIGGVIGGFFGLCLIGGFIFIALHQRGRLRKAEAQSPSSSTDNVLTQHPEVHQINVGTAV